LIKLVLQSQGNVRHGRELFLDKEKSQCFKCHRLGEQGGKIGPDLAGIGSRFSRIHLIESILEPSRTVAPSYETLVVVLEDGRVVTGVKVAETETVLTLGDNEGKTHDIPKSEIDEFQKQSRSTMPEGLEKRLTEREFVNLISYLLSQKKTPSR
jgi:putative heme-binding domain-containing protein